MPPLPGFSDNPFRTRDDVVRAALALLRPLRAHTSPAGARIRLPAATGAKFDESAAQLEGFARPLWAVASLAVAADGGAAGGGDASNSGKSGITDLLQPWVDGFAAGTDPAHPEYWGAMGDLDQRMVEAEIIAYALLAVPGAFFHRQPEAARRNIVAWLRGINGKAMPANNWRWFRVLTNLALIRVCGEPEDELRPHMEADLALLDSFAIGDTGWSSDGEWQTDEEAEAAEQLYQAQSAATGARRDNVEGAGRCSRQADYYAGSFAIQFSQLVYCRFAGDADPARAERYRAQARRFGASFWPYFDGAGAAIPFGRSQTYRFACAGFFAALAVAGVPDALPAPLSTPGAVKGFLLRHLRWWAAHGDDALNPDGTMNIGWLYPNMFMCESYNSPQSVYWCLKTLLVVALPAADAFWQAAEEPYPFAAWQRQPVRRIDAPRQLLCNHPAGNHHFLLSTSQYATWSLKAAQSKYSKFAYSSAFPFSIPTGTRIEQLSPDNMLALSRDAGETWAVKCQASEPVFATTTVHGGGGGGEDVLTATVRWFPWADRSVEVATTLVPPTAAWPDWHTRMHRIRVRGSQSYPVLQHLHAVEGGFAGPGQKRGDGFDLPALARLPNGTTLTSGVEGYLQTDASTLVLSYAGATGIAIDAAAVRGPSPGRLVRSTCSPLRTDPNTSLAFQRSLLPVAEHAFVGGLEAGTEIVLVSKVFAISTEANQGRGVDSIDVKERWSEPPVVLTEKGGGDSATPGHHIDLSV